MPTPKGRAMAGKTNCAHLMGMQMLMTSGRLPKYLCAAVRCVGFPDACGDAFKVQAHKHLTLLLCMTGTQKQRKKAGGVVLWT